ncbi:hypothetical protein F5050DRAFT_1418241 [Lentinula boryana]|uniref:Uncharacterized protein n=1 Tax=Lentinula boryana TaxID=40481 RepID=A0ABQ8QG71_9AGAR|nr:hypothetical protein F5050DRAFT_1418241 [Lentinula boryana]
MFHHHCSEHTHTRVLPSHRVKHQIYWTQNAQGAEEQSEILGAGDCNTRCSHRAEHQMCLIQKDMCIVDLIADDDNQNWENRSLNLSANMIDKAHFGILGPTGRNARVHGAEHWMCLIQKSMWVVEPIAHNHSNWQSRSPNLFPNTTVECWDQMRAADRFEVPMPWPRGSLSCVEDELFDSVSSKSSDMMLLRHKVTGFSLTRQNRRCEFV